MKSLKLVLLTLVVTLFSNNILANKDSLVIPKAVLEAFNKKYPTATNIEWERDALNFEAEFELDLIEYEATFSESGAWLETETEITEADLPKKVITAFRQAYPKAKIKEIDKVETPKSFFYEIEYKRRWKNKEVIFDTEGNQLQSDLE